MDFYLIRPPKNRVTLFTQGQPTLLANPESTKGLMDRWLAWLEHRPSRLTEFLKNLSVVVRDYYNRLEHRIDPMEHVFKLMRHASEIRLHYSPMLRETQATEILERLLVKQQNKHAFWLGVNSLVTLCVIALSPVLVPLPGPNVLFYYPGLRTISHFLAWRGIRRGLQLNSRFFFPLNEIFDIETMLNQEPKQVDIERLRKIASLMKLEHLPHFLERYI